ncbi:MAG: hypothetical protein AUH30_11975 [Candidatus Rokubacteria bacterium 13_1_40CM_68_15]|nr:MAG: hypothetical protein AUH30_11975 [Candidatus Rokubacteria bacterium 13_1_40CM_68_15]
MAEPVMRPRIGLNIVLFVLTCFTTLVSGAFLFASPTFTPLGNSGVVAALLTGAPFAFTLLSILGVHEFGHYFTARYYKAAVSLPYFIPAPPIVLFGTLGAIIRLRSPARDRNSLFDIAAAGPLAGLVVAIPALYIVLFGTLGAIIRLRSPARDRNSLFDIAAAGPLAGLVVAIPALYMGLQWSVLAKIPSGDVMQFGDPLLLKLLVHLKFGAIPAGMDVFLHPVAVAGWAGFFVTALNLFPLGQLDGGRIAYALFGRHHRMVGFVTFGGLILLGIVTQSLNWFVWAALLFFLVGFHHTPPLDDVTPLTTGRRVLGWACLILLVLLIPPVPIAFSSSVR